MVRVICVGLEYAQEKMDQLLGSLAANPDPLPERLETVYLPLMGAVDDATSLHYLPPDILSRMRAVQERLTAVEAHGGEGRLRATLDAMSVDEAWQIAKELVALRHEVFEWR